MNDFNRWDNTILPPCKGCEKRSEKCHSKCTEYKAFVKEHNRRKAIIEKRRRESQRGGVK